MLKGDDLGLDKIIDTEFEEISSTIQEESLEENNINGEPLYYNTMHVSKAIDENDSTVRYWSTKFQSILNIKISNKAKRYTKKDIDKFKFIKHLIRVDKLTLEQVKEYCTTRGFDSKEGIIDVDNPLAVKTFIAGLMEELNKNFTTMQTTIENQQDMIISLQNTIIKNNDMLKQEVSITVDEVIAEKNEELKQDINTNVNDIVKKEIKQLKEDIKYISQEEIKKYSVLNQHQGLFSKWFGKK